MAVQVSGGVDPSANVVDVINDLSSRGLGVAAGELIITGAVGMRAWLPLRVKYAAVVSSNHERSLHPTRVFVRFLCVGITKDMKVGDNIVVAYTGIGEVTCVLAGMEMKSSL